MTVLFDPRYKLVVFEYWCQTNLSHEMTKNLVHKVKEDINNIFDQYVGTRENVPMMSVHDVQIKRLHIVMVQHHLSAKAMKIS